jgi:dynein heavy chain
MLEKMEKVLNDKMAELKEKKDALAKVEARLKELSDLFESKVKEKDDLEKNIKDCEIKLDRA